MHTDNLVIGAGVYGISLANHLVNQKQSFIITGKFMDLWRNHTFDKMTLRSNFPMSEIAHPEDRFSCENYFRENPSHELYRYKHLPVAVFRKYLDWVEKNLEFEILDDRVVYLDQNEPGGFTARFQSGKQIMAKNVVVAAGISYHAHIPAEIRSLKDKTVHSYNTLEIRKIKNSRVLVIGGGQSAAECLEALNGDGNTVEWYHRHTPVFFEQPVKIPSWIFHFIVKSPGLFRNLPPVLRKAVNDMLSAPTIMPAYRPIFSGHQSHDTLPGLRAFDRIVSATGFQFHTSDLDFLSEELRRLIDDGSSTPRLNRQFESAVSGLYFCGTISESYFGPAVKFIIGSRYCAAKISRAVSPGSLI